MNEEQDTNEVGRDRIFNKNEDWHLNWSGQFFTELNNWECFSQSGRDLEKKLGGPFSCIWNMNLWKRHDLDVIVWNNRTKE